MSIILPGFQFPPVSIIQHRPLFLLKYQSKYSYCPRKLIWFIIQIEFSSFFPHFFFCCFWGLGMRMRRISFNSASLWLVRSLQSTPVGWNDNHNRSNRPQHNNAIIISNGIRFNRHSLLGRRQFQLKIRSFHLIWNEIIQLVIKHRTHWFSKQHITVNAPTIIVNTN